MGHCLPQLAGAMHKRPCMDDNGGIARSPTDPYVVGKQNKKNVPFRAWIGDLFIRQRQGSNENCLRPGNSAMALMVPNLQGRARAGQKLQGEARYDPTSCQPLLYGITSMYLKMYLYFHVCVGPCTGLPQFIIRVCHVCLPFLSLPLSDSCPAKPLAAVFFFFSTKRARRDRHHLLHVLSPPLSLIPLPPFLC